MTETTDDLKTKIDLRMCAHIFPYLTAKQTAGRVLRRFSFEHWTQMYNSSSEAFMDVLRKYLSTIGETI